MRRIFSSSPQSEACGAASQTAGFGLEITPQGSGRSFDKTLHIFGAGGLFCFYNQTEKFFSAVQTAAWDPRATVFLISLFSAWTADPQPGSPALPLSEHWGSREAAPTCGELHELLHMWMCVCTAGCGEQQALLISFRGTPESPFKASGEITSSVD